MSTINPIGAKGSVVNAVAGHAMNASKGPAPQTMTRSEGPSELDRHRAIMAAEAKQASTRSAQKRTQESKTEMSLAAKIAEAQPSPMEKFKAQIIQQAMASGAK